MSTRMALLRSARSRIQRDQIGTLIPPNVQKYLDAERKTLLQIAAGARESHHLQIALNAVIRAQSLEPHVSSTIVQESSAVFWALHEQKIAIQSLKQLALPSGATQTQTDGIASQALVLARLVSFNLSQNVRSKTHH
jgi:serine-protein kinase ATM